MVSVDETGADDVSGGIDLFLGGDGIGGDFDDAVAFDGWDPKRRAFEIIMSNEFLFFIRNQNIITHNRCSLTHICNIIKHRFGVHDPSIEDN
jgi:hypothetical protein